MSTNRLSQTALDYNDFRHRDLDSTSEESFGRPVDNAKDIEAQSLQFKLKRVIGMNLSSILSMSVMPIVWQIQSSATSKDGARLCIHASFTTNLWPFGQGDVWLVTGGSASLDTRKIICRNVVIWWCNPNIQVPMAGKTWNNEPEAGRRGFVSRKLFWLRRPNNRLLQHNGVGRHDRYLQKLLGFIQCVSKS